MATKPKRVLLKHDDESVIGTFTLLQASKKMKVTVESLTGYLDRDGYLLVDDPELIWAEYA